MEAIDAGPEALAELEAQFPERTEILEELYSPPAWRRPLARRAIEWRQRHPAVDGERCASDGCTARYEVWALSPGDIGCADEDSPEAPDDSNGQAGHDASAGSAPPLEAARQPVPTHGSPSWPGARPMHNIKAKLHGSRAMPGIRESRSASPLLMRGLIGGGLIAVVAMLAARRPIPGRIVPRPPKLLESLRESMQGMMRRSGSRGGGLLRERT